jgi:FAD:protein FMN transferase
MKKYLFALLALFLMACSSDKKVQTVQLEGFIFGTTYHITFLNTSPLTYQKEIDSLFYLINKSLSTYIPASDISKINSGDSTVIVDDLFIEVFQKSKRIFNETEGFFDPTVGSLVNAWGFGPNEAKKEMDSLEVHKMMQFVGFEKVLLKKNTIVKQYKETFIDFNSIAKGFGADVIGRFLEGKQVHHYLVEIGGEIRARGKNAKNNFWKVAIEKPNTDGSQSIQTTIELENASMATSGNYRKFRITKEGNKYVHTINSKTGFATESNLLSASVISKSDCADVDGYATAFMAMGLEKAKDFLTTHKNLHVVLIYSDDQGILQEFKNF